MAKVRKRKLSEPIEPEMDTGSSAYMDQLEAVFGPHAEKSKKVDYSRPLSQDPEIRAWQTMTWPQEKIDQVDRQLAEGKARQMRRQKSRQAASHRRAAEKKRPPEPEAEPDDGPEL